MFKQAVSTYFYQWLRSYVNQSGVIGELPNLTKNCKLLNKQSYQPTYVPLINDKKILWWRINSLELSIRPWSMARLLYTSDICQVNVWSVPTYHVTWQMCKQTHNMLMLRNICKRDCSFDKNFAATHRSYHSSGSHYALLDNAVFGHGICLLYLLKISTFNN